MTTDLPGLLAKLYLDEDIHKRVAYALRLRGFDVVSTSEVGNTGLSDSEQLAYAVAEKRALVTFNVVDYVKLNKEYLLLGKDHYGIVVSSQLPIGETIRRLLGLLNKLSADRLKNTLLWL